MMKELLIRSLIIKSKRAHISVFMIIGIVLLSFFNTAFNVGLTLTPTSNDNGNTTLPIAIPADGFPRAVIANPCSGSSATLQFTSEILEAHGYSIFWGGGGEPLRNPRPYVMKRVRESLVARQNNSEPSQEEINAEILFLHNEMAVSANKIFLFKIKSDKEEVILKKLTNMGTRFAYTYRSNYFDRAICTVVDCFRNAGLGDQVNMNGTKTDACFDRRKSNETFLANFNDPEATVRQMQDWEISDQHSERFYMSLYNPAESETYEDLFQFEYTDSEEVFNDSVKAWCAFLKTFGEIKQHIVEGSLRRYKNSRPPLHPYDELVYNFDELKRYLNITFQ